MEITNTVTIATKSIFSTLESLRIVTIFEDKLSHFMDEYPDVYAGSSFIKAENGLRYIFIIPSDNQEAIDASKQLVAMLDMFHLFALEEVNDH